MSTIRSASGPAPGRHRRRRCAPARRWARCLVLFAVACGGCLPGYVRVILHTTADSNKGRPMSVLVRRIDEQQYRGEPQASAAALVIRPDASVLKSWLIEPTKKGSRAFWVKSPKDKPLGIYFFYTSRTASWKLWLPPPLPWRITVPLGPSGVTVDAVRECRCFRN